MTRISPGGTVGILGGGQLARMLALEARRMGYRVAIQDPDPDASGMQLADHRIVGAFGDPAAAAELAACSDVITLDTEHVPVDLLEQLSATRPVRPGPGVLRIIQDRLEQRRFLTSLDIAQTAYAVIERSADLAAASAIAFPAVLKTRRAGYDGKGQVRVADAAQLPAAWEALGCAPAVLETFVRFAKEISVLLARATDGRFRFYPIAENEHRGHILHTSRAPARVSVDVEVRAQLLGARIATALDHVGMMAVELFLLPGDELLVNEIAPRTHNSGHFTLGGCVTSQFEQHLRAICGLPLGDPTLLRPVVMLNLLGELWSAGPPRWDRVVAHPTARLHLYGKRDPVVGRKMGHVLVIDDDADAVVAAICSGLGLAARS